MVGLLRAYEYTSRHLVSRFTGGKQVKKESDGIQAIDGILLQVCEQQRATYHERYDACVRLNIPADVECVTSHLQLSPVLPPDADHSLHGRLSC